MLVWMIVFLPTGHSTIIKLVYNWKLIMFHLQECCHQTVIDQCFTESPAQEYQMHGALLPSDSVDGTPEPRMLELIRMSQA